jgi:hypothetical protein
MPKSSVHFLLLFEVKLVISWHLISLVVDLLLELQIVWNKRHVEQDIGIFKFESIILVIKELGCFDGIAVNHGIKILHLLYFILSQFLLIESFMIYTIIFETQKGHIVFLGVIKILLFPFLALLFTLRLLKNFFWGAEHGVLLHLFKSKK